MKILTLAFIVFLFSCSPYKNDRVKNLEYYNNGDYGVIEIDGCEYIISYVHAARSITHKGNCKFCLNRN